VADPTRYHVAVRNGLGAIVWSGPIDADHPGAAALYGLAQTSALIGRCEVEEADTGRRWIIDIEGAVRARPPERRPE
jgi:hypothetical protein